jgi:4-carboxymuconolactone decarboxylase
VSHRTGLCIPSCCLLAIAGVAAAQNTPQAAPAKSPVEAARELQLRGDRFPGLAYDNMTPAQKAITERAVASRGAIGTFNILLRSPELSEAVRGTAGRARAELSPKLAELAILLNARYWTTQFEWLVHRQAANREGLSTEFTTAIAEGRRPGSMQPDEQVVYDFVRELLRNKQVSDQTFAAAKNLLGETGIVDLLGLVGFYQATSWMMNVDRYPMQPNQKAELKPLANPLP